MIQYYNKKVEKYIKFHNILWQNKINIVILPINKTIKS